MRVRGQGVFLSVRRVWLSSMTGGVLMLLAIVSARAEGPLSTGPDLSILSTILERPETEIDLAEVKLVIDQMIDDQVDVSDGLAQLDTMAKAIAAELPDKASSDAKLTALRTYLYQPGSWNDQRPFQYDFEDPFGYKIENKLLTTYLRTRKGNCVSMPILFVLLGQKLGIDVTAAAAPEHVLVKYKNDDGNILNLEATDGAGVTSDSSYQRQIPMTRDAIANGVYLRPLSKKETIVLMMSTLMEFYGQRGRQTERIALANLALAHDSRNVVAMLHISSANYQAMKREFMDRYPNPKDIPPERRAEFAELGQRIHFWRSKAEQLGWREPDNAANESYLKTVNDLKNAQ